MADSQEVLNTTIGGDPVAKMVGAIVIGAVLGLALLKRLSIKVSA